MHIVFLNNVKRCKQRGRGGSQTEDGQVEVSAVTIMSREVIYLCRLRLGYWFKSCIQQNKSSRKAQHDLHVWKPAVPPSSYRFKCHLKGLHFKVVFFFPTGMLSLLWKDSVDRQEGQSEREDDMKQRVAVRTKPLLFSFFHMNPFLRRRTVVGRCSKTPVILK